MKGGRKEGREGGRFEKVKARGNMEEGIGIEYDKG